jgi:hypothetical protein
VVRTNFTFIVIALPSVSHTATRLSLMQGNGPRNSPFLIEKGIAPSTACKHYPVRPSQQLDFKLEIGNCLPVLAQCPPSRAKGRGACTSYQSSQRGQEDIQMFIALADKRSRMYPGYLGEVSPNHHLRPFLKMGRHPIMFCKLLIWPSKCSVSRVKRNH